MKTTFIIILFFGSIFARAQQSDIMYVPDQKTIVASYNHKQIGFYLGGYYMTAFPHPYIYTTPISIINRVGLTYINKSNTISIMGGVFVENYIDSLGLTPDIWIKIYPLRFITKERDGFDFVFGLNYMNNFRYGIGVSIPIRSIYN